MGLDMYLEGRKNFYRDYKNPDSDPLEDGYRIKEVVIDVGYWRKHPDLHGYIVKNFADGVDNCLPVELSIENIQTIITAIEEDSLIETQGFFFGTSQKYNDEGYVKQKSRDIKLFKRALNWVENTEDIDKNIFRYITYRASW